MANIEHLIALNEGRWQHMHINASKLPQFHATANRLCTADAKARFMAVQDATGVPWFVVAVIAEREYGGPPHWDKQLAQGDPLSHESTHIPRGEGPYLHHSGETISDDPWFRAAVVALKDDAPHAARWKDWSGGGSMTILEEYNGLGYANMGRSSPYVWAGTDQYSRGKYTSDGHYDPNAVDQQLGCAGILAAMMAIDSTIKLS